MNPEIPGDPTMEPIDGASSRPRPRLRVALLIFAATFFAVMLAAGVVSFFMPRQYYSQVTLEVNDDTGWRELHASDPIRSGVCGTRILYPIIDSLKLTEVWGAREGGRPLSTKAVYNRLSSRIVVSHLRKGKMSLGVYSTDRQEAAQLANMIAAGISEALNNDEMRDGQQALTLFKEQIASRKKEIDAAQAELRKIRERDQIVDPHPESLGGEQALAPAEKGRVPIDEPRGPTDIPGGRSPSEEYDRLKETCIKGKIVLEAAEGRLATYTEQIQKARPPVRMWDKAEPSLYPVNPKVVLIMLVAAGGGALLGFVFAGIYLLRASRRRDASVPLPVQQESIPQ